MILVGDFNFAWSEASAGASCGGKWAAACKDWTKSSRGTVNADEDAMKGPAPTFVQEDSMDDKDGHDATRGCRSGPCRYVSSGS